MGEDPLPISNPLNALAARWGIESPAETGRIFARWEQIVGPEVAARCRPTSLKAGVLKVRTESAVWASEFRFLAADVVRRINDELGKSIVREVKPWVKAEVGENRPMTNRSSPPRPSSSRGSAQLAREAAEIARGIKDPQVSEALQRALVASKISKGGVS